MANNQFAGEHVINIDEFCTFPGGEVYDNESRLYQIHRIHSNNHDEDKKDYEPSHLSIGPYHHGSPAFRATEKMKWECLHYFLTLNHEKNLHDYIKAINKIEKQARSFYGDEIKMDKKSFVEMLLLDACFILMTFNGIHGIAPDLMTSVEGTRITMDDQNNDQLVIDVDENRRIIETNECHANGDEDDSNEICDQLYIKAFFHDMLLLENQIPFFVIIKVYETATIGRSSISLLVKNIIQSVKYLFGGNPEATENYNLSKEIYHLLHLCHMYFKPHRTEEEICQNKVLRPQPFQNFLHLGSKVEDQSNQSSSCDHAHETLTVRKVTEYHEARIKLKKRESPSDTPHSLLDIKFVDGILEIPCLSLDPETFTLLKNLIVFEQICPQSGNYFKSYALFWSQFMTTTDDVALLIETKIINHNFHRDHEVVDQFRSLTDCVVFNLNDENYLTSLCHMMEAYYRIRRAKWKKWLVTIKSTVLNWTRHSTLELLI